MPLDKIAIASSSGLLSSLLPSSVSPEKFNSATQLKLGPAQMTEKLREEVVRVLNEEEDVVNGDTGTPADSTANGHSLTVDANGDVEMGDASREGGEARSPSKKTIKLEPEEEQDPSLISPEVHELLPPPPGLYKVTDVKREVEAVRDKRKMIRLGPKGDEGGSGSSTTLPSIVAFTMFDTGEE